MKRAVLAVLRDWERWAIPFDADSFWTMVMLEWGSPGLIQCINRRAKEEDNAERT